MQLAVVKVSGARQGHADGFHGRAARRPLLQDEERPMQFGMEIGLSALGPLGMLAAVTMTAAWASGAEIRVMSGGAPQEVLAVLTPEFEKQSGHTVKVTFAVVTALRQKLDAGEKADMVLLPDPVIDAYVKAGKMRADGRAALGQIGLTVIVRQGAPQPDVSTPESFRQALLDARAVVHATPTATPSGAHMAKVIEQLGIAEAMRSKVVHRPALDGGVALVAKGEADIGIYPTSEVVHVQGITQVGPLPPALQLTITYAAAVTADGASPEAASAFIKFLSDPANRKHWKEAGFDPPAR
jgi:molybdate transport system substrate-binding protein